MLADIYKRIMTTIFIVSMKLVSIQPFLHHSTIREGMEILILKVMYELA